jgi:hypothetical protein
MREECTVCEERFTGFVPHVHEVCASCLEWIRGKR